MRRRTRYGASSTIYVGSCGRRASRTRRSGSPTRWIGTSLPKRKREVAEAEPQSLAVAGPAEAPPRQGEEGGEEEGAPGAAVVQKLRPETEDGLRAPRADAQFGSGGARGRRQAVFIGSEGREGGVVRPGLVRDAPTAQLESPIDWLKGASPRRRRVGARNIYIGT